MLATIERRVPVSATCAGSLADNCALPSSMLIWMSAGLATDSVPFGPLTLIDSAWALISTPLGSGIGFLAMRDMVLTPLGHDAQDFTADALLSRMRIVLVSPGGCNYRHAT